MENTSGRRRENMSDAQETVLKLDDKTIKRSSDSVSEVFKQKPYSMTFGRTPTRVKAVLKQ